MRKEARTSILDRLLSRLRRAEPAQPATARPRMDVQSRPFQAISIYRGVEACGMARRFSDHRFLSKDAPKLPLAGCTMSARCECHYVKHRDRRGESRRLIDFGVSPTLFDGKERRKANGRRERDE